MTVRDRYDAGRTTTALHAADQRARHIQWSTQRECERYTINMALLAEDRGEACPFARDLVAAYRAETSGGFA